MANVTEVARNIYLIDDQLFSIPERGSVYLINEEKKALIDTGPTSSVNTVLDGVKQVGVRPQDIDYLVVTHIHIDHAGGAGVLLQGMPQAQVVVHHKGARHLVNPSKLVSSMIAVQGEEVMRGYGKVLPIEAHRVKPVYGDEVIRLGEAQILRFFDAPGHAQHELCIHESRNNGVFTGDAAGIFLAQDEILLPSSPPPNFDLELYVNTLERLKKLKASQIYFAHFGVSRQVEGLLQLGIDKARAWGEIVARTIGEYGFDDVEKKIVAQFATELRAVKENEFSYDHSTKRNLATSVAGYIKYYRDKYGDGEREKG